MKQARIYDIKSDELPDYTGLISSKRHYIFWSLEKMSELERGDEIWFVNQRKKEVLHTVLSEERKAGTYDKQSGQWTFYYEYQLHTASKGTEFARFDIKGWGTIPGGWKWEPTLGRSRQVLIWKQGIEITVRRIERLNNFMGIFKDGKELERLRYYHTLLQGYPVTSNPQLQGSIDFNDEHRKVLMAIKTKPFLLLAGINGVGKSHLVRALAYRTCTEEALRERNVPGNFELLKVKPSWHDSAELMGYPTQQGRVLQYVSTPFILFLVKAWRYPEVPFFLCLDEMNLAPAERYFAEFLSILETRRYHDNGISSDAFISKGEIHRYAEADSTFWKQLGIETDISLQEQFLKYGITLPANLIVIGTVNIDETTYTFSKKILDRAMTIEMDEVDMDHGLKEQRDSWQYPEKLLSPDCLLERLPDAYHAYQKDMVIGEQVISELKAINSILRKSSFRIAYRVRDEILLYCAYNADVAVHGQEGNWLYKCLDEMILMKILSRIEGNEITCREIIKQLLERTYNRFPESYHKLEQMQSQLLNFGNTSFWKI